MKNPLKKWKATSKGDDLGQQGHGRLAGNPAVV